MDCRLFERLVQLDIDGLLSVSEREEMLQHAQACPSCAALLQEMTELAGLLSARLSAVEAPAGFAQAVMAALPQLPAKQVAVAKIRRPVWQRWGSIAAAAVLLLAAGLYGLWPAGQGDTPPGIPDDPTTIVADTPDPSQTDKLPIAPDPIEPIPNPISDPIDDPADGPIQDPIQNTGDNEDPSKEPEAAEPVDPPPVEKPPVITPTPPIVGQTGAGEEEGTEYGLDLPASAFSLAQPGGMFSLTVLAAYKDCDAILPSFTEGGLVKFYTKYKNKIFMWTQTLSAEAEPEYQDQVTALPTLSDITGSMDESATAGFSYVSALSPDKRYTAVNRSGEQPGVWRYRNIAPVPPEAAAEAPKQEQPDEGLEISATGGGKVLSWSPDGNKLLYTDSAGKLFVYYIFERNIQSLYNGTVTCASWAKDSKTVVFSGKPEKKAFSAIYTIIVP